MGLVKDTLKANPNNSVIGFKDNSSAIRCDLHIVIDQLPCCTDDVLQARGLYWASLCYLFHQLIKTHSLTPKITVVSMAVVVAVGNFIMPTDL